MPELPEVETIRRTLESHLIGTQVRRVRAHRRDIICLPGDPPAGFARSDMSCPHTTVRPAHLLSNAQIVRLTRRGKRLAIVACDGRCVEVHLGMSGRLLVLPARSRSPAHTHIVWSLTDGKRLVFCDPRRFGFVRVHAHTDDLARAWQALGPDALTIRADALQKRAGASRQAVKGVLLDQRVLAGVGNIYADEALFDARIAPTRAGESLTQDHWRSLARSIRRVLRRAIEARGTTLRDYRNADGSPGTAGRLLRVYARAGAPCTRCGKFLVAATVAQRTTTWCPACQT